MMLGLSKMLSNMRTDMAQITKSSSSQKSLASQLNLLFFNEECKDILKNSLNHAPTGHQLEALHKGGSGNGNNSAIQFFVLKDDDEDTFLDSTGTEYNTQAKKKKHKEKLKQLYALGGHTLFQLSCKDGDPLDCDCSAKNSCSKKWALSLFTQSYKNNLPVYKTVWNQNLKITYDSQNEEDFECNLLNFQNPRGLTFFGIGAGRSLTTGKNNSFLGYQAGYMTTTGKDNSFLGYRAGYHNTEGEDNSFLGSQAGYHNSTGSYNSFLGFQAGYHNTTGKENSFMGYKAGYKNTTGSNNLFLGAQSGSETSTESHRLNVANVIYGLIYSSDDPHPSACSAPNTSGHCWIPDGHKFPDTCKHHRHRDYNVYPTEPGVYVHGQLKKCDEDGSNCQDVVTEPTSSREYKKNIAPFHDYERALKALLTTPLFNYQYIKDYPEKTRMGIISEELPESLQLPTDPIQPDWLSIYGHLWAGIKALHKELKEVQEQALTACHSSYCGNPEISIFNPSSSPYQGRTQTNTENLNRISILEKIATYEKIRDSLKIKIPLYQQKEEELKKEIARLKKQEELFKRELQTIKQQIQN